MLKEAQNDRDAIITRARNAQIQLNREWKDKEEETVNAWTKILSDCKARYRSEHEESKAKWRHAVERLRSDREELLKRLESLQTVRSYVLALSSRLIAHTGNAE